MVHTFGPFQYDTEQRALTREGRPVHLIPKAIDILHVLLERRGRIVEKNELMNLVWPGTTVEEIGIARNVSILRKALGEDAEESRYIETIPKRGYRFIAAGGGVDTPAQTAARQRPSTRAKWFASAVAASAVLALIVYWQFYRPSSYLPGARASIVIVPFDIVGAGVDEPVAASLNDLLVTEISRIPGLHVVSPATVRRYRSIGFPMNLMARLLGSQVILEGAIHKIPAGVRANARLSDVHAGKVIWAETYEYDPATGKGASTAASRAAQELRTRLAR